MQPRGIRNYNFGNIEDGPFARSLPGYVGTDGRFARFDSPDNGMNAMDQLLSSYGRKGRKTVADIVGAWAPSSDGNNVSAYANYVAKQAGISPTQVLNMEDPAIRKQIALAMANYENGETPMASAFSGEKAPMNQVFASARPQAQVPGVMSDEDPALSSRALVGPGGLFGTNFGDRLQVAGAHLRDDPSALGAVARLNSRDDDSFSTSYDAATGTVFRLNKKTGEVTTQRNPNWTGEKVDPSALKHIGDEFGKVTQVHAASERAAKFVDMLDRGELKLDLLSKGKATWENLWGNASPETQKYNDFEAFKSQMINAILVAHKGVQTEGDAQRAADQFLAGLAKNDTKSARNALDNLIKVNGRLIDSTMTTTLDPYKARYNNPAVFEPYERQLKPMRDFYSTYGKRSGSPSEMTITPNQRPPLSSFVR